MLSGGHHGMLLLLLLPGHGGGGHNKYLAEWESLEGKAQGGNSSLQRERIGVREERVIEGKEYSQRDLLCRTT